MNNLELSFHAQEQASRRNFSLDDIYFVVRNGKRQHGTGAIFFQMRAKDIPDYIPANDRRRNLVGATVLTCKCKQYVITMYRNPNAFKKDSKKPKYDKRAHGANCCPCCQQTQRHII